MKKFIIIISLIAIIALITVGMLSVHAQEAGINLIASPLPITLSAKPGTSVSTELRVKNGGTVTERLKVRLLKFGANDNGEVKIADKAKGDDYFDWVTLTPGEFNAEPGEWKKVKMTVNVPKEASFGYYYAVSFARANQTIETTNTTAKLEGQLVTFVLLEAVVPGAKKELTATSFTADKSTYEFLPTKLSLKIKNTGNVHVVPKGNIFITRGGKTITTLNVNSGNGNVLPYSTRTFSAEWSDGFPVYQPDKDGAKDKKGQPKQSLKWDFAKVSQLRFGKYTAKMVLVYDDGRRDVPIEGQVSFWVIPWRLVGTLTVVLILAGVGLWSTGRSLWRRIKKLRQRR